MISYKSTITYDGTPFFGWQKTITGPSIQQTLEEALFRLTQENHLPEAASRTDRGVHAEGQVIAFSLEKEWVPGKLQQGLNAHLPPEIRILAVEMRQDAFHPTLLAKSKEYHYRICHGDVQDPIHRLYSWHFHQSLNRDKMERAALDLLGTKDFSSFANEPEENPICHLSRIEFQELGENRLQISLSGDRFLYKMARTIAGTLLYVGCGKLSADCMQEILNSKRRALAGVTAPAHGLFLHRVFYE